MKFYKYITGLIITGLLFTSSCKDTSTLVINPDDVSNGVFVTMDVINAVLDATDLANAAFTATVDAPSENVASYDIQVARTSGGVTSDTVDLKSYTSFPVDISLSAAEIASVLGLTTGDFGAGDKFDFVCSATGTDGLVATFDNLDQDAAGNAAQRQGFNYSAYVACPQDLDGPLAGDYTALSAGTNTDGQLPNPAVDIEADVTVVFDGGLDYIMENSFAGMYELWYCAPYGYCFANDNAFINVCGNLSGNFTDSWGLTYPIDGTLDESTGVITYHYINAFGDEITTVLTPATAKSNKSYSNIKTTSDVLLQRN